MDDQDLLRLTFEYAEFHNSFDTEFLESLKEQFERRGFLSEAQSIALRNIVDSFFMLRWSEQHYEKRKNENFEFEDFAPINRSHSSSPSGEDQRG